MRPRVRFARPPRAPGVRGEHMPIRFPSGLAHAAGVSLAALSLAQAARAGGSITDLGVLPGGVQSVGHALSADGRAASGDSGLAGSDSYHAFRWTPAGMQDLGT